MVEDKNIIIQGYENYSGLVDNPKLLLQLNNEFKSMGFKKVVLSGSINKTTAEKDLTLYINPENNTENMLITSSMSIKNKVMGYMDYSIYCDMMFYYDKSNEEEVIQMGLKWQGLLTRKTEGIIGSYLKDRNIVTLGYKLNYAYFNHKDKNICTLMLGLIKEWLETNKEIIKVVDVKETMKRILINSFQRGITQSIRNKENNIVEVLNNIQANTKDIIHSKRQVIIDKETILTLKRMKGKVLGRIFKEIEEIKKLPFVKKVEFDEKGITLNVGDINIKYEKQDVYIGEFEITISYDKVYITNLKPLNHQNISEKLYHPHMEYASNRSVCFGNRSEKINDYLSGFEFKKLVYFVYLFLKSYNRSDCYHKINYWIDEDYHPDGNENENEEEDNGEVY